MDKLPILSTVIYIPAVGGLLLLLFNKERKNAIRGFALFVSLVCFGFSIPLLVRFDMSAAGMQFVEKADWIPRFGIQYLLGLDGISLFLVILTTFLTPICILASWSAIQDRVKEYMIVMLLLETGMLGVFLALDLILFFVFWEIMLVPMYLLIGIWGGPKRIYAAIKFVIYTMVGSALMLIAFLTLHFLYVRQFGVVAGSFNVLELYRLPILAATQIWLFLAFGLAFAIKVPMFPFHTWLPDAHVEAPTAGSVILAGILLKMGTYGFVRFCLPLFPDACYQLVPLISVLAIIGIIYGALVSAVQKDVKKLVAYSSVSHLGFVMLGIFALNVIGLEGGILQMINHGLSTGALFLIVGIIYERRHTRMIEDFGGLWKVLPLYGAIFMIVTLSSIGLPGLNGFVGEFLILQGTFLTNIPYAAWAATGVVLAAIYMLWMFERVMFGPIKREENRSLRDINAREALVLVPIVLCIFWIGLFPRTLTKPMEPSVNALLAHMNAKRAGQVSEYGKIEGMIETAPAPMRPPRIRMDTLSKPNSETAAPAERPSSGARPGQANGGRER
jgi:NADH-quinone oxidoreductase subunit M